MSKFVGYKTTEKGTELPLLDLRGKPYLQVAHRLVWFRERYPTGNIVTSLITITEDYAIARAEIAIDGRVIATGTKKETEEGFPDFIEKAETGAIGRALAIAGFGTQFEPEFDEEDRLADAPIEVARKATNGAAANSSSIAALANVLVLKGAMSQNDLTAYLEKTYKAPDRKSWEKLPANMLGKLYNDLNTRVKELEGVNQ